MKNQNRTLHIFMNGVLVGKLEKTKTLGLIFSYNDNWLNLADSRPISLSLPLVKQPYIGEVVYNFFDNLLPDNDKIRKRIQANFKIPTDQPFDLLATIGKDCIGAIQLVEDEEVHFEKKITGDLLTEKEIASILRSTKLYPFGMSDKFSEFRISIAGMQEKSALLYWKNHWYRPLGTTPTTHIFKLPIGYIDHQHIDLRDSGENEWLCAQVAKAFGLSHAKCEIQHFEDVKVLVVERFDRKMSDDKNWIMRLPQEDMCQALGCASALKYQSDGGPGITKIMKVLLDSEEAIKDRDDFFRTQILFWLLAAIDGHAKNFSLFIEPYGKYRLTPLYDIISAHPLLATKNLQKQKIKMAMVLRGKTNHYKWNEVQRRYFLETAKTANFSKDRAELILDEMLNKVDEVIEMVSKKIPATFPKNISEAIFDGMLSTKKYLVNSITYS